jgi:phosphate starvation-inducible PhoH-like protein
VNKRSARRNRDWTDYNPEDQHEHRKKAELKYLTKTQKSYGSMISHMDVVFGIGAAGTGKTHVAAMHAAMSLLEKKIDRIVICRPAIEAGGERIGYLPGGLNEKMDPYMRPIFDVFREVWHPKSLAGLLDIGQIEIVPLGYMRGRTFKSTFIVADEMQNATPDQMLMLLTRLGANSKMVITGDPMQCDINHSPFDYVRVKLAGIKSVGFIEFSAEDVVRHPTVEQIVNAWAEKPKANGHALGRNGRERPEEAITFRQ